MEVIKPMDDHYLTPETERLPYHGQGNSNLCWAFSALTCLELKLLKLQSTLPSCELVFSRTHMRYSCYQNFSIQEPLSWGANLGSSGVPGTTRANTVNLVKAYFSRMSGPVYDFMEPFQGTTTDLTFHTFAQIETVMTKAWQVNKFVEINDANPIADRILEIKKAVLDHGAVAASICYELDFLKDNEYFFCYVNQPPAGVSVDYPNHAVTIIGWDDRIKASQFSAQTTQPARPGAFLVRDSSISGISGKNYYYVSYEDAYIVGCNYYLQDIRPWYTAMNCYQHNYYGAMHSTPITRYISCQKLVTKVKYKKMTKKEEVVDSILVFNTVQETMVSAYIGLPQSDGTYQEQKIITEKTLSALGYEIVPADSSVTLPVILPADANDFYLKVVYHRGECLRLPLESNGNQRLSANFKNRLSELSTGIEFLVDQRAENDYDLASATNKEFYGRLAVKLFTRPKHNCWTDFCSIADKYTVAASLQSLPNNLAVIMEGVDPITVTWELKRRTVNIDELKLSSCTLINLTACAIPVGLHATFSCAGATIDRFFYTSVMPACVTLQSPTPPAKGVSTFTVTGIAAYAKQEVRIILWPAANVLLDDEVEAEIQKSFANGDTFIGKGMTDANGQFSVLCNYDGYGKVTLQAEIATLKSNLCTIEIEKSYEEEDDPKDPKKKKIKSEGTNGFDQALRFAMVLGVGGTICYVYYRYCENAPRRAGYELTNTFIEHLHVDSTLGNSDEEIVFPDDLPEDYVFIKSMVNSSVKKASLNAGPGVTLFGHLDKDSYLKNCQFTRSLSAETSYVPVVDTLDGGFVQNCRLNVQGEACKVKASFSGLIHQMNGGKIEDLYVFLPQKLTITETFSGVVGALFGETQLINCHIQAPAVSAQNGAGLCFRSDKSRFTNCSFEGKLEVTDGGAGLVFETLNDNTFIRCWIKGQIKGRTVAGLVGYALRKLTLQQCLAAGSVEGTDLAAGILGCVRQIQGQNQFLIENCLSTMDCTSTQGYAGGLGAMCGLEDEGTILKNCIAAGNIRGSMGSSVSGLAVQAQSAQSSVVLTNQITGSNATLSAGTAAQCFTWDDIMLPPGAEISGWTKTNSQKFYDKSFWDGLDWDWNDIWVFTDQKYPYLNAFATRGEPYYPFLYITPNQSDGTCQFKTGTTIVFQGTYPPGVTNIHLFTIGSMLIL